MDKKAAKLSALYYPFSRCINPDTVKQFLLTFDSVTFLDSVTDDDWRASLMEQTVYDTDAKFADYAEIHDEVEELKKQEALCVRSPDILTPQQNILSAASAFSDLTDKNWCRVASRPDQFQMPFQKHDGLATWQIFKPKLPDLFVEKLTSEKTLRNHLIDAGDDNTAWTLSYEAGSAISTSLHLAAAEHLSLAPITDSPMHHQLLFQKVTREYYGSSDGESAVPSQAAELFARQTAFSLVKEMLPAKSLKRTSLKEVLGFRAETAPYRDRFISQLTEDFARCKSELNPERLNQLLLEISKKVSKDVMDHENDLARCRDKIWPNFVSSLNTALLPAGAIGAVSFQYIGGPGAVLAGSVAATGLAFLKGLLDINVEIRNAQRSASPAVAYLSKVRDL